MGVIKQQATVQPDGFIKLRSPELFDFDKNNRLVKKSALDR